MVAVRSFYEWCDGRGLLATDVVSKMTTSSTSPRHARWLTSCPPREFRVGEALSLFTADLHFGGGSARLRCSLRDPHLHVRTDNPVENDARANGAPRRLFVHRDLVESCVDYIWNVGRFSCRRVSTIAVHTSS